MLIVLLLLGGANIYWVLTRVKHFSYLKTHFVFFVCASTHTQRLISYGLSNLSDLFP